MRETRRQGTPVVLLVIEDGATSDALLGMYCTHVLLAAVSGDGDVDGPGAFYFHVKLIVLYSFFHILLYPNLSKLIQFHLSYFTLFCFFPGIRLCMLSS